ncbi:MAG: tetraacyldisaccharide 4'-kinase [Pelagibacterales bacterium]|nr:tetraacyldisaccharide 4'-kinase [Pelagibacterales bacterium]
MNFKKPKFWDYSELSFWSIILYPFSLLFLFASLVIKLLKIQKKFPIPIICVGNIYLGGTGKTPLALEIFKIIKSSGKNPGFVKKGYDYLYDEIQMLEKIGKTYLNKNRKEAISSLISLKYDVAILDDGFQDFSIKKDFSILCFNSKQLIGNGFLIPSGPLREGFKSIKRAECIFINGDKNVQFENKINKINKNAKIFYSKYKIKNIDNFKNKEIIAFAGIGNPSNFFDLLKENKINVKKTYSFPDHHNYSQKDFDEIIGDNHIKIVTTEKDYYRMNDKQKLSCDYIEVDLEIENKNEFINLIKNKI